ncbi:hypothetical protein LCGC14_2515820, partial [marine sediment metagenome]
RNQTINSLKTLDKNAITSMSISINGHKVVYNRLGWLIRRAGNHHRWLAANFTITIDTGTVYENEYMKFYSGSGLVETTEEGKALLQEDGEEGLYDMFDPFYLDEWSYCPNLSYYGHLTKTMALITLDYNSENEEGQTDKVWFFNDYQIVLLSEYLIRHGKVQLIGGHN